MEYVLEADRILNDVIKESGLSDFGDPEFVNDYLSTLSAINRELELSEQGVGLMEDMCQRMLTNRLRMISDFKANPEIREEVLAPPVVITGFARSGTTKLQRVLSSAPQFQSLLCWKVHNPAPFPGSAGEVPDPRIAWAEEAMRLAAQNSPEAWAAHPSPANDAEEDFLLHDMTFLGPTVPMRVGARQLLDAFTPIRSKVYEFLRDVLKYLQWQDASPDRASRPWVLKSPIHLGSIDVIQRVFPGAKIIHCHRNLDVSITSSASIDRISRAMYVEHLDLKEVGQEAVDFYSKEWSRNVALRQDIDPSLIYDVRFDDFNNNALATAEQLFSFVGVDFDDAAKTAIQTWEAANKRHQHGKHSYDAQQYGLNSEMIRNAFQDYIAYFSALGIIDN